MHSTSKNDADGSWAGGVNAVAHEADDTFVPSVERKTMVELVGEYPILEVGIGNGELAITVALCTELQLVSIDSNPSALSRTLRRAEELGVDHSIEFIKMDAAQMIFPDSMFGTILSYHSLHHVMFPFRVVDEMFRVCKDGGSIIVSEFNERGFDLFMGVYYEYPDTTSIYRPLEHVDIYHLWDYFREQASNVWLLERDFVNLIVCKK